MRDVLIHHHIYRGTQATAIPEPAHRAYSKFLHPFNRNSKYLAKLNAKWKSVAGKAGRFGSNFFTIAGAYLDVFSDNPESLFNTTFGNGSNVGQIYKAINEDGTPVEGTYYVVVARESIYNDDGDLTAQSSTVTFFHLETNEETGESEFVEGETKEFLQTSDNPEPTEFERS